MRWYLVLRPQLGALFNAEAVLLVNYHKPQLSEYHVVLNQRVGANQYVYLACGQARLYLAFLRCL